MAKNVIIGQSGGPTAVINSSLAGVYKAACSLGADKVYGMKYGIEGLLKEELIELNVLLDDRMSIELLKRTPSSYLGSCRYKLPDPDTDSTPFVKLFTLFDKYDICAVFYIGGNDSMDTIAKLSRYGADRRPFLNTIRLPRASVRMESAWGSACSRRKSRTASSSPDTPFWRQSCLSRSIIAGHLLSQPPDEVGQQGGGIVHVLPAHRLDGGVHIAQGQGQHSGGHALPAHL